MTYPLTWQGRGQRAVFNVQVYGSRLARQDIPVNLVGLGAVLDVQSTVLLGRQAWSQF
jgi:hypothetical protein